MENAKQVPTKYSIARNILKIILRYQRYCGAIVNFLIISASPRQGLKGI